MASSGDSIYTGGWKGILQSSDFGASWNLISQGQMNGYIFSLGINQNNYYAGSYNNFFTSSNFGASWSAVQNGPSGSVWSIGFSADRVIAGGNGIFLSTDYGVSWQKTMETGTNLVNSVVSDGTHSFASVANNGIYKSDKNCVIWEPANNGLPSAELSFRNMVVSSDWIYAGSFGSGIYKAKVNDFNYNSMEEYLVNTDNIRISPNPISDFLTISNINRRVNPTVEENSIIEIFSFLGIKVASYDTPPNPLLIEGEFRIDVSGLLPGVYFVRVGDEVGKFIKI